MRTRAQVARPAAGHSPRTPLSRRFSLRQTKAATPGSVAAAKSAGRVTRSSAAPHNDQLTVSDSDEELSSVSAEPGTYAISPLIKKRTLAAAAATAPEPSYRRPKRRRHASGYYDEDTGDEDELDAPPLYFPPSPSEETRHPDAPPRETLKSTPRAKSKSHGKIPGKVAAKAKESTTRCPVNRSVAERKEGAVVAVAPPWDTLPYYILGQIFEFASAPLDDIDSVRWLVGASRTCRAFAEPALTALYKKPPCLSQAMAHKLVALLARPPSRTMFNYRQKIESLVINVGDIASRVYLSHSLNLRALVQHLGRLTEIDLFHEKDMAPYRQLDMNLRWQYPAGLFVALGIEKDAEPSDDALPEIKLKAWRWSARMMGQEMTTDQLESIHKTPSMASLQKLSFVNFQRPSLKSRQDADQNPEILDADLQHAKTLAASLSVLPDLKHLVFESSTAANDLLLPRLPDTIEHLELINCWDVRADNLSDYLMSHGRSLRYLTLHHNQSLSLGFLPVLGIACPNLRALRMNLTYYNHHEFYNDSDPMYDVLLLADQVPSWPASLQVLELENLRRWSPEAAETFFSSLEQSAHTLQDLRRLGIKAMLDIPWRQRSEIRDKWEGRLKRAFLRKCPEPIPFRTLGDFKKIRHLYGSVERADRQADEAGQDATNGTEAPPPTASRRSRRSQRIASQTDGPSPRAGDGTAKSPRRAGRGRVTYREPDSDEDVFAGDTSEDELATTPTDGRRRSIGLSGRVTTAAAASTAGEKVVQGMCQVVDIRFDNQKPTERQYGMDDFLDSDGAVSDDEDWHSDMDDAYENPGYAW